MVSIRLLRNTLYEARLSGKFQLTMIENPVSCGVPASVQDSLEKQVDLNDILIRNRAATYLFIASGDSMINEHIPDGALLVIDSALAPRTGHIVLADINGELTLKKLDYKMMRLLPANPAYEPIPLEEGMELRICGVLTKIIIDPYLPYVGVG